MQSHLRSRGAINECTDVCTPHGKVGTTEELAEVRPLLTGILLVQTMSTESSIDGCNDLLSPSGLYQAMSEKETWAPVYCTSRFLEKHFF